MANRSRPQAAAPVATACIGAAVWGIVTLAVTLAMHSRRWARQGSGRQRRGGGIAGGANPITPDRPTRSIVQPSQSTRAPGSPAQHRPQAQPVGRARWRHPESPLRASEAPLEEPRLELGGEREEQPKGGTTAAAAVRPPGPLCVAPCQTWPSPSARAAHPPGAVFVHSAGGIGAVATDAPSQPHEPVPGRALVGRSLQTVLRRAPRAARRAQRPRRAPLASTWSRKRVRQTGGAGRGGSD